MATSIVSGFITSKGNSLNDAVGVRIKTKAKALAITRQKALQAKMKRVSNTWNNYIAANELGTQYPGGLNLTPNPFRRTGKLQESINTPVANISLSITSKGNKIRIKFNRLFERRPSGKVGSAGYDDYDVGKLLNEMKGKTFAGWQTRARSNLLQAIKKEVTSVTSPKKRK